MSIEVIVAVVSVFVTMFAQYKTSQERHTKLIATVEELTKHNTKLENKVEDLTNTINEMGKQIVQLQTLLSNRGKLEMFRGE